MEPRILTTRVTVDSRLAAMGLSRELLRNATFAAHAARNDATEFDPFGSGGQLAYIYGTRALRQASRERGWTKDQRGGIEAVRHPRGLITLRYQNTTSACVVDCCPQPVTAKGPSTKEQVRASSVTLALWDPQYLNELAVAGRREREPAAWFLCVSADAEGRPVSELLLPSVIDSQGMFGGYLERIFIVQPGDWLPIRGDDDQEPAPPVVTVTRK